MLLNESWPRTGFAVTRRYARQKRSCRFTAHTAGLEDGEGAGAGAGAGAALVMV